jgi:hypothetical protein
MLNQDTRTKKPQLMKNIHKIKKLFMKMKEIMPKINISINLKK